MLDRPEIVGACNHTLREQKAGGQLAVGTRRAHDHGERPAVKTHFERLFGGGPIRIVGASRAAHAHDVDDLQGGEHRGILAAGGTRPTMVGWRTPLRSTSPRPSISRKSTTRSTRRAR